MERKLPKLDVAGSIPVSRSMIAYEKAVPKNGFFSCALIESSYLSSTILLAIAIIAPA